MRSSRKTVSSLAGELIVVTGAAQGLGRAMALRLARDGVRLALWDREHAVFETAELCAQEGNAAKAYVVDVGARSAIEQTAGQVLSEMGSAFGLVNNAGIFPRASVLDLDPDVWDEVLRVNLTGAFHCCRAFAPAMVNSWRGSIVNVSSSIAFKPVPRSAHYAASKAGLIAFTKSLALELSQAGVRANCIVPGVALTAQPLQDMTVEQLHEIGHSIPLGRIGQPEDIAGVVAFLLGEDASYITGQSIAVNGGALMLP